MKNNKGVTLIELVIAIAIISVIAGYGLSKTEVIQNYEARETYQKLQSTIADCKVSTMSWSQVNGDIPIMVSATEKNPSLVGSGTNAVYMEIYRDPSDKCFYYRMHAGSDVTKRRAEPVKISTSRVKIFYRVGEKGASEADWDRTEVTGEETKGLIIAYNRSTGAFLPFISGPRYIRAIEVACGNRNYRLTLMPDTGRVLSMKEVREESK